MNGSFIPNRPGHRSNSYRPHARSIRGVVSASALAFLILLGGAAQLSWGQDAKSDQNPSVNLKQLSLEQLGNVEVTTASKEPEEVWKTASGDLRDHSRGHSTLRSHEHTGTSAIGAGSGSGSH